MTNVLVGQLVIVSLVEQVFTLAHSTPAVSTPAPQVTLLMRVSQHIHSVDQIHLVFMYVFRFKSIDNNMK